MNWILVLQLDLSFCYTCQHIALHYIALLAQVLTEHLIDPLLFFCFFFSSELVQPLERLGAGGVHCNRCSRLLVCLHPEPQLKGSHGQDDERPGGTAESRAESSGPAAKVSVTSYILPICILIACKCSFWKPVAKLQSFTVEKQHEHQHIDRMPSQQMTKHSYKCILY